MLKQYFSELRMSSGHCNLLLSICLQTTKVKSLVDSRDFLHAALLNKFMWLNKLIINLKKNFFNGLWKRRKMTGFELKGRRRTRMGSTEAQDSFK